MILLASIPLPVRKGLLLPELRIRRRAPPKPAIVGMPEAPVDEGHRLAPREDEIGPAGQAAATNAVAKTPAVKLFAHMQLERSALLLDALHALRARCWAQGIRHAVLQ